MTGNLQQGRSVREVLVEARGLVERGWHQSSLTDGCGNYCLRAAISLAAGSFTDVHGRVGYLPYKTDGSTHAAYILDLDSQLLVRAFLPEGYQSIPVFNDDLETTQNDVLGVLDKAIASVAL